jgi:hypothetical protein
MVAVAMLDYGTAPETLFIYSDIQNRVKMMMRITMATMQLNM